ESFEALQAQRDALAERAPELALAVEGAQVRLLAARKAHDETRALHARAAAYEEARAEQERLEAKRPQLAGWRQEVALALRAEPVLRAATQCERLEVEARRRKASLGAAKEQLAAALALRTQRRDDAARLPELETALSQARARAQQLHDLVALETELQGVAREQEAAAEQLEAAGRELAGAEARAEALTSEHVAT